MYTLFSLIHLLVILSFFALTIFFGIVAVDVQLRNNLISVLIDHPLKLLIPSSFFLSVSLIISLLMIHAHRGKKIHLKGTATTLSLSIIEEMLTPWIKERSSEKLSLEKCSQSGNNLCLHIQGDLSSVSDSIENELPQFLRKIGYASGFSIELLR